MVAQPKKIPKSGQHSLQASDGDGRIVHARLFGWKAFPFGPECFRSFRPEILPKWKVPLEIIDFQRPLSRVPMKTSAQDPCLDSL